MDAKTKNEIVKLVQSELEKQFPKKDFIELKMNMETVMRHEEKNRKANEDNNVVMISMNATLDNIEKFLIPHPLNNNKGLVSEFSDSKVEIEKLKGIIRVHRVYFALLGFLILGSGIIAYIAKPIIKQQIETNK